METMVQATTKHGMDVIHDPLLSKGTAFSLSERERLGIRGLVPPRTQEMDKQLQRIIRNLRECRTPLEKFIFMTALQVCVLARETCMILEHLMLTWITSSLLTLVAASLQL
jgi:hypothetical protein